MMKKSHNNFNVTKQKLIVQFFTYIAVCLFFVSQSITNISAEETMTDLSSLEEAQNSDDEKQTVNKVRIGVDHNVTLKDHKEIGFFEKIKNIFTSKKDKTLVQKQNKTPLLPTSTNIHDKKKQIVAESTKAPVTNIDNKQDSVILDIEKLKATIEDKKPISNVPPQLPIINVTEKTKDTTAEQNHPADQANLATKSKEESTHIVKEVVFESENNSSADLKNNVKSEISAPNSTQNTIAQVQPVASQKEGLATQQVVKTPDNIKPVTEKSAKLPPSATKVELNSSVSAASISDHISPHNDLNEKLLQKELKELLNEHEPVARSEEDEHLVENINKRVVQVLNKTLPTSDVLEPNVNETIEEELLVNEDSFSLESQSAIITPEQKIFIEDEAQMLLVPDDDVVLGVISNDAILQNMSFHDYFIYFNNQQNKILSRALRKQNRIDDLIMYDNSQNIYSMNFKNDMIIDCAFDAVKSDNLFALRAILDSSHRLDDKDKNSNTLLLQAVESDNYRLTYFLLMRGSNIKSRNSSNYTALDIANNNHNDKIRHLLLRAKMN